MPEQNKAEEELSEEEYLWLQAEAEAEAASRGAAEPANAGPTSRFSDAIDVEVPILGKLVTDAGENIAGGIGSTLGFGAGALMGLPTAPATGMFGPVVSAMTGRLVGSGTARDVYRQTRNAVDAAANYVSPESYAAPNPEDYAVSGDLLGRAGFDAVAGQAFDEGARFIGSKLPKAQVLLGKPQNIPSLFNVKALVDQVSGRGRELIDEGAKRILFALGPKPKFFEKEYNPLPDKDPVEFIKRLVNDGTVSLEDDLDTIVSRAIVDKNDVIGPELGRVIKEIDALPEGQKAFPFAEIKAQFSKTAEEISSLSGRNRGQQLKLANEAARKIAREAVSNRVVETTKGPMGFMNAVKMYEKAVTSRQRQIKKFYDAGKTNEAGILEKEVDQILAGFTTTTGKVVPGLRELRQELISPTLSFRELYNSKVDISRYVIGDRGRVVAKNLGEVKRAQVGFMKSLSTMVDQKALSLAPGGLGQQMVDLKSRYRDLASLTAMFNAKRAAMDLDSPVDFKNLAGDLFGFISGTTPRSSARNLIKDAISIARPQGAEVGKNLSRGQEQIKYGRALLGLQKTPGDAVRDALALQQPVRAVISHIIAPSIAEASTIDDIQESIYSHSLKEMGLVTPEGMIAPNVPPEQLNMVKEDASMAVAALRDAIDYGNEDIQALALSDIIKRYPSVFQRPETGILGEVKVGNQIRFPNPQDAAIFGSMIKKDTSISSLERAEILTELNRTGAVVKVPKSVKKKAKGLVDAPSRIGGVDVIE